jgi:DNA polymerase-3 subunit beta
VENGVSLFVFWESVFMKFIISRPELAKLVSRLQSIVASKTPVPLLSNFLIEAKDSTIILTATDLTVAIRCTGGAKVIEPGATTLPARRFAQLIQEITALQVEITTNSRDITQVVANTSTFRVHGLPRGEFPDLPDMKAAPQLIFKQGELREALMRTSFAVAKDDNRFILTGICCQLQNSSATFIGTDAKQLARASIAFTSTDSLQQECVIPLKAVDEILKILTNDDQNVTMRVMQDKVSFEANEFVVVSKLLSGEYPDVERVIPTASHGIVHLNREELITLLRQVSLFTTEDSYSTRFTFLPGELQLTTNTMDIGEGKVSMPANYAQGQFDIAFNPLSVLNILKHNKSDTVSFAYTDAYNPAMIADGKRLLEQNELPNPLYVLMPLRLNEE